MTSMYTNNNANNNTVYTSSSQLPPSNSSPLNSPQSTYNHTFNNNDNSIYNNIHNSTQSSQQQYNIVELSSSTSSHLRSNINVDTIITNVWSDNLYSELRHISDIIDQYNYIAMDTEFPGVVARPVGSFKNSSDYHYQTLKCNVDLLKLIQLGICLCDCNGNILNNMCVWQFNFKFSLAEDMYAQDSIDLLQLSGINFDKHQSYGIDILQFAELLITSGIVLNDEIKWITFHSGYDFAYLLKLITNINMPSTESEFFDLLLIYFPCIYDMKYIMKSCDNLNGGLQRLAEMLLIERIGPQHQAGSDALLTAATFFKLRSTYFNNIIDDNKFMNILYGLNTNISNGMNNVDNLATYNNTDKQSTSSIRRKLTSSVSNTPIKSNDENTNQNNNSLNQITTTTFITTTTTTTPAAPPGF